MNDFLLMFLMVIAFLVGMVSSVFLFADDTPDNFDSMLCRYHAPIGAILVNDEIVSCTNGLRYRVIK